jgi:hypothetical protein
MQLTSIQMKAIYKRIRRYGTIIKQFDLKDENIRIVLIKHENLYYTFRLQNGEVKYYEIEAVEKEE